MLLTYINHWCWHSAIIIHQGPVVPEGLYEGRIVISQARMKLMKVISPMFCPEICFSLTLITNLSLNLLYCTLNMRKLTGALWCQATGISCFITLAKEKIFFWLKVLQFSPKTLPVWLSCKNNQLIWQLFFYITQLECEIMYDLIRFGNSRLKIQQCSAREFATVPPITAILNIYIEITFKYLINETV
jgi:hypothetical protein